MSYFATELDKLLKEKKMTPADLARISGESKSSISRMLSGVQIWVSPENLAMLAKSIDSTPFIHGRLLCAHLLDECTGPGKKYIEIRLNGNPSAEIFRDEPTAYGIKLAPKLQQAMDTIAAKLTTDTELRNIILSLGSLYTKGNLG